MVTTFDTRDSRHNAWGKAPGDIARILADAFGCRTVILPRRIFGAGRSLIFRIFAKIWWKISLLGYFIRFPRREKVLFQGHFLYFYGLTGYAFVKRLVKFKRCEYAFLIHDLPGHMQGDDFGDKPLPEGFVALANASRGVIVHNAKMLEWFAKRGILREKLVNLEIFDYLAVNDSAAKREIAPCAANGPRIVFAGNLSHEKSPFLAKIGEIPGIQWELYGNPAPQEMPGISYRGSLPPDELPAAMRGEFGLVWDGETIDGCTGPAGSYLRLNNPHKMSLYLAAGFPVIVWREAAQADFVKRYACGILVDSLEVHLGKGL